MPITINGQILYSTTETCKKVGISRSTLSGWIKKGVLKTIRRDRRGFKLFTEDDLIVLRLEIEKIDIEEVPNDKQRKLKVEERLDCETK